jgi:hypothetical protein
VFAVAGFVEGVVACDPGIGLVVLCELGPEPDGAVLVVLVCPECGVWCGIVGVPVWILTPWDRVHVEDCVNFVFCTLRLVSWVVDEVGKRGVH